MADPKTPTPAGKIQTPTADLNFEQRIDNATSTTAPGGLDAGHMQTLADPNSSFESRIDAATTVKDGAIPHYLQGHVEASWWGNIKVDFDKHYSNGAKALQNGLTYADVLDKKITLDQAKSLTDDALNDTADLSPFTPVLSQVGEMLPGLQDMGATFLKGAAVGGTGGAVAGVAGGPLAEITIPSGAMAGAIFVGGNAVIYAGGRTAAGLIYRDLINEGIPENDARNYALGGGAVVAAFQRVGVGLMGKQIMAAAVKETAAKAATNSSGAAAARGAIGTLTGKAGDSIFKQYIKGYLSNMGVAVADITLQNTAATVAKTIAKLQNGIAEKDLPAKIAKGFLDAWGPGAIAPVVSATIGTLGGTLAGVHTTPDLSDIHGATRAIHAVLHNEALPEPGTQYDEMPMTIKEKAAKAAEIQAKQQEQFLEKQKQLLDEAIVIRDEVLKGATTTKTGKLSGNLSEPESKVGMSVEGAKRVREAFGFDMEGKLDTLLQHLSKVERKAIWKKLNPGPLLDKVVAQVREQQTIFHLTVQKHTGLSAVNMEKLFAKSGRDKVKLQFTDTDGKPATWEGAMREALGLKLDMEHTNPNQPNPMVGVHAQGWTYKTDVPKGHTTSLEHQLDATLKDYESGNLLKVGEAVKEYFNKFNKPILKRAVLNDTGTSLVEKTNGDKHPPVYAGKLIRRGVTPSFETFVTSVGGTIRTFVKEVSEPMSAKEMTQNEIPVERRDPITGVYEAINNTAHYDIMTDLGKTYNVVLNDPNVQKAAKIQHGSLTINELTKHADMVVNGIPNTANKIVRFVNKWMSNNMHALLSVDPKRHAMHALQFTSYALADVGGGQTLPGWALLKGVVDYHKNPTLHNDFLYKNVPGFKEKYADGNDAIVGVVRESDESVTTKHAVANFLGGFLTKGAKYCDQMGTHAVYIYMRNLGTSKVESLAVAGEALKSTQYSRDISKLSTFALDPNMKGFGAQATQYPTMMAQHKDLAVRDFLNQPGRDTFGAAVKAITVVHLSEILFAGVATSVVFANPNSSEGEKDNALWQLKGKALLGPQPLLLGAAMHDIISSAHYVNTYLAHKYDPSIEVANEHLYGFSFMPVEAVASTFAGLWDYGKIAIKQHEGEEVKTVDWVNAYTNIARGVFTPLRYTAGIANEAAKKLRKDEKENSL